MESLYSFEVKGTTICRGCREVVDTVFVLHESDDVYGAHFVMHREGLCSNCMCNKIEESKYEMKISGALFETKAIVREIHKVDNMTGEECARALKELILNGCLDKANYWDVKSALDG